MQTPFGLHLRLCLFTIAVLLTPVNEAAAQSKTYLVRQEDSHVGFAVTKWMVFKEEGRFKDFSGTVIYDDKRPEAMSVEFVVRTASIDSRNNDRDQAIRSRGFLNVREYPTMSFKSVEARRENDGKLELTGDLTIRGVTRRLTVPVNVLGLTQVPRVGDLAGFEATFVIDRYDFGVSDMPNVIGREVTITLMVGAASDGRVTRR
jgi:polyisoprenoid-binding protein YceI